MKFHFTNRNIGNHRLILIFTGWSTDYKLFESLAPEGWDILVAYDYRTLEADFSILKHYSTIYLYAWSLGVAAANSSLQKISINKAFAINGTLFPCHDTKGISEAIYHGTSCNLSETNLLKFRKRVFGSSSVFKNYEDQLPKGNLEGLKEELAFIESLPENSGIKWDAAFISENDRIFPAANQRNAWNESGVVMIEIPSGHHYPDFAKLLKSTIVGIEQIRKRFQTSLSTYDAHASAQRIIASALSSLFKERIDSRNLDSILEIGAGSGLLTKAYSDFIKPKKATFIDLYKCGPFGVADKEEYHTCDAENWIENLNSDVKYDAILSSSVIQWFINPQQFLTSCARHLSAKGVLAISTFLPDNLKELSSDSHSQNFKQIRYLSLNKLKAIMTEIFYDVTIQHERITVHFSTRREMIEHLILTGAGASRTSISADSHLRLSKTSTPVTLTYSPVYIIASHPKI